MGKGPSANGFHATDALFRGGKTGALVSTGYYPDLHLKYEDVLFALLRRTDETAKFTIVLTRQWRKGEKEEINQK